jgi:uncharacterized membrane protein (UPF0127 family)
LLGDAIGLANTGRTRRVGLLKHSGLQKGEGLWIVPCEAIHTFFMRFPIDVVYLDRKRRVTKVVPNLGPWRLSVSWRGHSVVELPVGTIEQSGTSAGDVVEVEEQAD